MQIAQRRLKSGWCQHGSKPSLMCLIDVAEESAWPDGLSIVEVILSIVSDKLSTTPLLPCSIAFVVSFNVCGSTMVPPHDSLYHGIIILACIPMVQQSYHFKMFTNIAWIDVDDQKISVDA